MVVALQLIIAGDKGDSLGVTQAVVRLTGDLPGDLARAGVEAWNQHLRERAAVAAEIDRRRAAALAAAPVVGALN